MTAEPLNINGLIRDAWEIMALIGVTEAADVLPELRRRLTTLVPQQPVQARTTSGDLIWQHIPCGWPAGWLPDATPDTGPDGDPIGCHEPGPWRPLLVAAPDGGTPEALPTDAELDIQIGEVTRERDEARAAVRSLKAELARVNVLLIEATPRPDPMVLRLPEVPEGTVALVGVRSGVRYSYDSERDEWSYEQEGTTSRWYTNYQAILNREHPDGVRVELAPPREPRTAAEIWYAMPDAQAAVRGLSSELAEALDREAGL